MSQASQVLLIGSGGVGTIAALNIESGGKGRVTAVVRSNYDVVHQKGFQIESCDHGVLKDWRPARSECYA
jgi:ketopantoate reductase